MVSGSQLQVAKLAQMCKAVLSDAQRSPAAPSGAQWRSIAPNSANKYFFKAHYPFCVLFKKRRVMTYAYNPDHQTVA